MAKKIPLSGLGTELERRIRARINRYGPDDPKLKGALYRIGLMLEAEMKINIRRKGIVDTGRLLNSIRTELYKKHRKVGVRVGSFGVPYAAQHEFGGPFTDRQRRAMFASLRDRGKLGPVRQPGKGVIVGNRFRARPYARPAVRKHYRRILEILKDLVR